MASTHRKMALNPPDSAMLPGAETDRTGKASTSAGKKKAQSPRGSREAMNPLGGDKASAGMPSGGASSSSSKVGTPRSSAKKLGTTKAEAGKAKDAKAGKEPQPSERGGKLAATKPSATPLAATAAPTAAAAKSDKKETLGPNQKKIEFFTDELLSRKPLDDKAREALIKKCGPAKQEVHFERNENHRPMGRPDELTPSRHERVPPSSIVLMFNCFEASFDLSYGDISSLPESETTELRSLTSGKSLGRVKITPEKGTLLLDRTLWLPALTSITATVAAKPGQRGTHRASVLRS